MSEQRRLIAETNYEMWETRDPHGARHILKQNLDMEPPADVGFNSGKNRRASMNEHPEYSLGRRNAQDRDLHDHKAGTGVLGLPDTSFDTATGTVKPKKKGSKRRTLPPTPGSPAHNERKIALSTTQAIYQHPDDLLEEEQRRRGGGYGKTMQPLIQLEPQFFTYTGTPAGYYDAPKIHNNAERGAFFWGHGLGSSVPGADIQPVLGNLDRHYQQEVQFNDRHLLQSLRVAEDPNVQWRMDKIKAKIMLEDENHDDGDLPDVFIRLIDPRLYTGAHKARFKRKGATEWVGAGIEGRRDDTMLETAIAGQSTITRTDEPEMDAPNKTYMPWDIERMHPDAYYTRNINPDHTSDDVNDARMSQGRFSQMANEKMKVFVRPASSYDDERKVRASFCVDKEHSVFWEKTASEAMAASS